MDVPNNTKKENSRGTPSATIDHSGNNNVFSKEVYRERI